MVLFLSVDTLRNDYYLSSHSLGTISTNQFIRPITKNEKAVTALLDYRFCWIDTQNYSIYGFRQLRGTTYMPSLRRYANCPTAVNTILKDGAEVVKIIEIRKCFRKKSVI